MAETALLYFYQGLGDSLEPDTPVWWQSQPEATAQWGPLEQALDALQGLRVVVLISAADCLLTQVTLTRKQAGHLHKVLPYLLEEQLLDNADTLTFVAGKPALDQYPVVVVAKQRLVALYQCCQQARLSIEAIKVDADLLASQAPLQLFLGHHWLVLAGREQALLLEPQQQQQLLPLLEQQGGDFETLQSPEQLAAVLRPAVHANLGLDLLQSISASRKQRRADDNTWRPWLPLAGLAASVLLVGLLSLWIQQWRYHQAANSTLQQAQTLYQELFPDDRATAALQRQFQGRLARLSGGSSGGQAEFLALLAPVAQALNDARVNPRRMQFESREGSLTLDVTAGDYTQLETLQGAIRERGAEASIVNYRNDQSGVNARLRVEQRG